MKPLARSPRDQRPLAVLVYEALRDQIVDGALAPDTALVQGAVAEELGVSRTPVRDALNRLTHEGLATWLPGNGYIVNGLTEQDIVDIYHVRLALELLAVELAAGEYDPVVLSRAHSLVEEMAVADPLDSSRQFELNREFHRTLAGQCGNDVLLKMLDTLWDHPVNRRITRSYIRNSDNVEAMVAEHRELVAAARAGDSALLLDLTRKHIDTGYAEAIS